MDGLNYEEAATQLGISSGTVHTHMKQALKTIHLHLDHAGAVLLICSLMEQLRK